MPPGVGGSAAVAAGAVAVATATRDSGSAEASTGGRDVVDVLTTDHREATALIAEIRATTGAHQRRELADTLIAELVRHSVAEEMYVYPAMRKHLPTGDSAVEHDVEEHKQLETLMKELEGLDGDDPAFTDVVGRLEVVLADHVSDEEGTQFPALRASLRRDELVQLAAKVESAKKLAPTRPHPASPNNQLFHKVAGPGVGLVDRLRDRLSGRTTG